VKKLFVIAIATTMVLSAEANAAEAPAHSASAVTLSTESTRAFCTAWEHDAPGRVDRLIRTVAGNPVGSTTVNRAIRQDVANEQLCQRVARRDSIAQTIADLKPER